MEQHEFFVLQPVINDKRIYQSATRHILEFMGNPAYEITLAIRIDKNDPGSINDLLRLVPTFCKVIDASWHDAMDWINKGLTLYEQDQSYLSVARNGTKVEFQPIPEIGYIMVRSFPKLNLRHPKTEPEVN
ncbi:MAG: hypothetical protein AAGA46_00325 [Cyanobacteria bacterium P01_F01_bin.13]